MQFSGVINIDKSHVHAKGQFHMSKVKVKDVKINFVPIWAFLGCNSGLKSEMAMKGCKNLKVT